MAIKKSLLLCLFLVSSIFITSDALPAKHSLIHRLQKRSGLRLCGRMLVDALATLCQSEYYAPSHIKRNYAYTPENYPIFDNSYPDEMVDSENVDFFSMDQLSRRGIADECCMKSCNIVQLSSYCGRLPMKMK